MGFTISDGFGMNVCFFLQDTGSVYGAERATLDLAEGLRRQGANVTFALIEEVRFDLETGLRDELKRRGMAVMFLPCRRRCSRTVLNALRAHVALLRTDVLHCVGYKADVHAAWAFFRESRPALVAAVHGWLERPDWKERFYGWLDRKALRRFDAVIALSRFYEQRLAEAGIPRQRIVRIPSGLPREVLPALEETQHRNSDGAFTVGLMGRLSWEKNHAMLFEALGILKRQNIRVTAYVAGRGAERTRLLERARQFGISDQIQWLGYAPQDRFFPLIDAMILCSRIENLPYSILEAMAWRRPVIATRVGGIPDLVVDGETGYIVPPDDAIALADKIKWLTERPEVAQEMGRRARERLEQEFLSDRAVREHLALYERLMGAADRAMPSAEQDRA
jgi:glycosyltransferase involved in cell wall biosynthesis